jgi:O-antigen/teichoic acid export membrane protein
MSNVVSKHLIPTVFRDSALIAITDYISYGSMFVFSIVLSQMMGLKELSYFTIAFAIVSMVLNSLNSSFTGIFKREISVDFEKKDLYFGTFLFSRVVILIMVFLIVGVYLFLTARENLKFQTVIILVLAARALDSVSDLILSMLQVKGMIVEFGFLKAGNQILTLVVSVGLIYFFKDTTAAYLSSLGISAMYLVAGFVLAKARFQLKPTFDLTFLKYSVLESLPLLFSGFVFALTQRVNVFVVTSKLGLDAGGLLGTLINVINGVGIIASAFGTILFIRFSRTYGENKKKLRSDVAKFVIALASIGAFCAILLFLLSSNIVALYKNLPEIAEPVLQILSFGLIPIFAQAAVGYLFTVTKNQKDGFVFSIVSLILSFLIYQSFVGRFGILGAAYAFVLYYVIWVVAAFLWTKRYL